MNKIKDVIYPILNTNSGLANLLSKNSIDTTSLAIYENFAPQGSGMPYIIYSLFETNNPAHFGKNDGSLSFEIYTQDSTILAEDIKDELIKILDKQAIEYSEGNNIYFDYVRDSPAFSDMEEVIHHHLEFHFFYWRTDFINHLNTIPTE